MPPPDPLLTPMLWSMGSPLPYFGPWEAKRSDVRIEKSIEIPDRALIEPVKTLVKPSQTLVEPYEDLIEPL